jgi:hypothetical protein
VFSAAVLKSPAMRGRSKLIEVNRAPVLTLWAAVVAEHLGHDEDTALTLGRAVAGLNAQTKGRKLGIFKPTEKPKAAARNRVELCGRAVPILETDHGIRALAGDRIINPESVRGYLERSFGDDLEAARSAMEALAGKFEPEELKHACYGLYEQFRPSIPSGKRGWGTKGKLDLGLIRGLGK